MEKILVPPLKTQGIKTKLVPWLLSLTEKLDKGKRWVEPFMGSGVAALNMPFRSFLLCDANPHIIALYRAIQDGSLDLACAEEKLAAMHEGFQKTGEEEYYRVRARFNEKKDPLDFLIINRSAFNGLMRFNGSGGFNSPFCRNPKRFNKAHVTKIMNQIKSLQNFLRARDVELRHADFRETLQRAGENDIVYCDPPYMGRNACYYNNWTERDEADLHSLLTEGRFSFLLSTWKSDPRRENPLLEKYRGFRIVTRGHFYFIGPREDNRYGVTEAVVTNLP